MSAVQKVLVLLFGVAALVLDCPEAHAQSLAPQQALSAALAANPSLAAALADAVAARAATRAADNAHRPVFVASASAGATERFSGTAAGVARNGDQQVGGSLGLQYATDWGTVVSLTVDTDVQWRSVNRDPTTASRITIPPTSAAQASVSARQPLLRGGGTDANLADVRGARAAERQTRHERDLAVSLLVQDVLSAYWELWYAERALAVQRDALGVAERQREEARQRAELGTGARVDVLRFSSELAALRESVRAATATRRTRAIELGRLLAVAPAAAVDLVAAAPDPVAPPVPETAALLAGARRASPELLALEAGVLAARERVLVADDGSLSRLDLLATAGVAGLWTEDPLPGLQLPGDRPAFFGTLGLELELPFGPTAGAANLARTTAELSGAQARYRARLGAIDAQIASLREELEAARERVELTAETTRISEELAEAERQRLELGTTTPSNLVDAQQAARESALRRLRALVDVVTASLRLDHAAGRLLDRFHAAPGARS